MAWAASSCSTVSGGPTRVAVHRHHGRRRRSPGGRRHQAGRVSVRGQAVRRERASRIVRERARRRRRPASACAPLAAPPSASGRELVGVGARHARAADRHRAASPGRARRCSSRARPASAKELVARAIHARSARSERPFVAVNTSAIPHDLLEGEIFGHVRGGFTGAVQARKGLFTEADGGTLLLDEIGDMSFGLQAKLLRVLQFGDVRPVGSDAPPRRRSRDRVDSPRPADPRQGRSLPRGSLLSAQCPPGVRPSAARAPRGHPGARGPVPRRGRRRAPARRPSESIGPDALRVLSESPWPGNVRELASCVERGVVFGMAEVLGPEHFAPDAASAVEWSPSWPSSDEGPWTLRRMNRAYTEFVLRETGGDKDRAAKILGINPSTLYRWQQASKE